MSQEVIDRVTALIGQFDQRVQAASTDDWSKQSPCADWTARDVVVHVANNFRNLSAGLTGTEATQVAPDDDIVAAWNQSRDQFLDALSNGDLSTSMPGPMGPMPAEQMIGRIISTDILVHTWDLARAIGADESLDPRAVEGAYSGLKPMDAMIRRPGVFGPKVDSAPGVDTQTEFLNFLGRVV
ncbi:MAG: TIGR03086 family metal-binding protein [Ilumatobacteraceae bacterium]